MNTIQHLLCTLALLGLAACGGRGDGGLDAGDALGNPPGASAPSPSSGEPASEHPLTGAWGDSASRTVLLVAPAGAVYGLLSSGDTIEIVRGTLLAANGLVNPSAFDAVDMLTPGAWRRLSVSGSFQPKSQLLLASDTQGPLVNAAYDPTVVRPTEQGENAGPYEASVFSSNGLAGSYSATLDSDGRIGLLSQSEGKQHCAIDGHLDATSATIAIMDVALVFSGEACQLPAGTAIKGLAQYDPGNNLLWVFGMSEDGRTAILINAERVRG